MASQELPPRGISSLVPGPAAGAADRGRHRPAQLRRGPRDRPGRGERRDRPGHPAGDRLRPAQRHRGLRHRRPAGRRDRGGRRRPADLGAAADCSPPSAAGPTFVGTAVGHSFTSEPLSVIFLTLAAGSILYVDHPAAGDRRPQHPQGPDLRRRPDRPARRVPHRRHRHRRRGLTRRHVASASHPSRRRAELAH